MKCFSQISCKPPAQSNWLKESLIEFFNLEQCVLILGLTHV